MLTKSQENRIRLVSISHLNMNIGKRPLQRFDLRYLRLCLLLYFSSNLLLVVWTGFPLFIPIYVNVTLNSYQNAVTEAILIQKYRLFVDFKLIEMITFIFPTKLWLGFRFDSTCVESRCLNDATCLTIKVKKKVSSPVSHVYDVVDHAVVHLV